MNDTLDASRHTLKNVPTVPTDPIVPADARPGWNQVEPSGDHHDDGVPVVPFWSVGSFSELRRALFGKPVSAPGGGEKSVITDESDDEFDEVSPEECGECPSCGYLHDTQLLSGAWRCSRCDPAAEERRKRTLRMLATAERIRRENDSTESIVTHANPQP